MPTTTKKAAKKTTKKTTQKATQKPPSKSAQTATKAASTAKKSPKTTSSSLPAPGPSGLTMLWEADIGGGASGPLIAAGGLIIAAQAYLGQPKPKEQLVAVDARSGERRWLASLVLETHGLPQALLRAPDPSDVIVQTRKNFLLVLGPDGIVKKQMSFDVPPDAFLVGGNAKDAGGRIVMGIRPASGAGTTFVAFDEAMREVYRVPVAGDEAPDRLLGSDEFAAFRHRESATIRVHRVVDGSPAWQAGGVRPLAISDRHLLVERVDGNELVCLDVASGGERWRAQVPGAPGAAALGDDVAVHLAPTGHVTAFDLASGAVRWSRATHGDLQVVSAHIVIHEGGAWIGGEQKARAFRLSDGNTLWAFGSSGAFSPGRSFAVGPGYVVVQERAGRAAALRCYRSEM